jgi:methylmalonyl-CoA mutase cobalamin-binding domain/chain
MAEELYKQITQAIIDENMPLVKELTKKAIDLKISAADILAKGVQPGLIEAGKKFEQNEFFLTDLILVGDATKGAMELLTPLLKAQRSEPAGTMVIGTVAGDVHDIGKNIVSAVLAGAGFDVIDIGEDQPASKFAQKAKEINADIVGASAILGGAKMQVAEINRELKALGIRDKVGLFCGGWGFNEQVAKGFGADGFGEDAWDGTRKITEFARVLKEKKAKK